MLYYNKTYHAGFSLACKAICYSITSMARPSTHAVHPRELVLKTLKKRKAPMSAYAILEALSPHGIKGPPIVYRALSSLIDDGIVHKIHATSEYIACNCASDHDHPLSVLTICGDCHAIEELHSHKVIDHLSLLT